MTSAPVSFIDGKSVALSGDGSTALVGGPTDAENSGAAWVFTRSGSSFAQPGTKLTGVLEGGEGHFGASVALSSDGNDALVGAPREVGENRFDCREIGRALHIFRSERMQISALDEHARR